MRPRTRSPRNSSLSLERTALALACVSARFRISRLLNRCPRRASKSVDSGEHPVKAPIPDFENAAIGGKETENRFPNKVFGGNVAHFEAAVVRIVAVVAHHEIVTGRNDKCLGVARRKIETA